MSFYAAVERWRYLVSAYFPANQVENALAIMQCESSGDPYAHNPGTATVPEDSRGLYQININAHPQMAEDAWDPEANVRYAGQLYAASGWSPWLNCARAVGAIDDGGYVPPDNGGGYVPPTYTSDVNVPGLVLLGALLWILWG